MKDRQDRVFPTGIPWLLQEVLDPDPEGINGIRINIAHFGIPMGLNASTSMLGIEAI